MDVICRCGKKFKQWAANRFIIYTYRSRVPRYSHTGIFRYAGVNELTAGGNEGVLSSLGAGCSSGRGTLIWTGSLLGMIIVFAETPILILVASGQRCEGRVRCTHDMQSPPLPAAYFSLCSVMGRKVPISSWREPAAHEYINVKFYIFWL